MRRYSFSAIVGNMRKIGQFLFHRDDNLYFEKIWFYRFHKTRRNDHIACAKTLKEPSGPL